MVSVTLQSSPVVVGWRSVCDGWSVGLVDCPLSDGDGNQTLSNGEEKLAESLMKEVEPRKSIGGFRDSGMAKCGGKRCVQ